MSGINTEHKIYIKVLTPVHIGGAQEKHLLEGVDYLKLSNGKTYRLDWEKIYKRFDPDAISKAIMNGTMKALLGVDLKDLAVEMNQAYGNNGEIKACVRDGFGKAFIPGSSLKGALKSWLYTAFEKAFNRKEAANLLGSFYTDVFRLISPTDCYLDNSPVLFPTKTFNLVLNGSKWEGGWKHTSHEGTNRNFNNRSFVTDYECFSPDTCGSFLLKIRQPLINVVKDIIFERSIEARKSYELLYQDDSFLSLLHYVNQQVVNHIKLEVDFFKYYNQAEASQEIIETYERLLTESDMSKEGQCLLRLSAGSGFHGISGDHQFQDHIQTGIWTHKDEKKYKLSKRQAEKYVGNYIKFKSRKIAFTPNYMYPMGFMLLSNKPFTTINKKEDIKDEKIKLLKEQLNQSLDLKPSITLQHIDATEVKAGDIIFGEVIELDKPYHRIKLFLTNYPFEGVADLSGVKGYKFTVGDIINCKLAQPSKTGEFKMAAFIPLITLKF